MIDEDISALYLCRQVNWLLPNWFANSIVFIKLLNQNLNGKGVLSLKGEVFWFFNQKWCCFDCFKTALNLELVWLKCF
jgi:hypothetical protein